MRWFAALGIVVMTAGIVATGTITLAAPTGEGANINQCRNGAFDAHVRCIGSAFQNGNLGATNSHYREGDFVPFQALLTGLTVGPHTLDIQWDETASSKHAYDYIGTYTKTETNADACTGVLTTSQCGVHTTATVTADPNLLSPCAFTSTYSATQVAGVVDIYGASGAASFTYFNSPGSCQGSALQQSAHITFSTIAGQSSVVAAWGGHVASQLDWGLGNSASQISGSPYHMRLLTLDTAALGNQDRSIKAAAILPVPTITTSADGANGNVPTIASGGSFTDVATLTGDSTHGNVTGFVDFYMCGPTTAVAACTAGTQVGGDVILTVGATTPPSSTATSASVSPTATGYYCFRVLYTPDATAGYSPGQSTSTTNECVHVVTLNTTTTSTPQTSATETGTFTNAASAQIGAWIRDKAVVSDTTTPTGSIVFHVCGPTTSATACTSGGSLVAENSGAKTSNSTSVTFYSAAIHATTSGWYCFRADFTGTGAFDSSSDSSTGECIEILPVPTITTSADSANGNVPTVASGGSFTDVATLTGDSTHGNVTGFVDFYMCGPTTGVAACTTGTQVGGDVTLTVGATTPPSSTATSDSVSPTATGYYCFRVVYTPDATAAYSPSQSTSTTNECVQVVTLDTRTTSTPQTSSTETGTFTDGGTPTIGAWIRDRAVVSDTTTPTGTIAFSVCGPTASATACTSGGSSVAENSGARASNSTSVTFYSAAFQPTTSGWYCFRADFTGTGAFNNSSDSSTGECIHILPASPAFGTTPSATTSFTATLNDSASIGPGNNPTGSVTFRLYDNLDNCNLGGATVGQGGLLFQKVVALPSTVTNTKSVSTTDTGTATGNNVVSTAGIYEWVASYSGDTNNDGSSSLCGDEAETVTASSVSP
jgi:hypothetical protein